jgi:hypothetical protein
VGMGKGWSEDGRLMRSKLAAEENWIVLLSSRLGWIGGFGARGEGSAGGV